MVKGSDSVGVRAVKGVNWQCFVGMYDSFDKSIVRRFSLFGSFDVIIDTFVGIFDIGEREGWVGSQRRR